MIKLGIKKLIDSPPPWLSAQRLGLLCNQASVDENFVHSRQLIEQRFPAQLTCLFSPQHGFFAEKQDNMIESNHRVGPNTPIFSLYGKSRRLDAGMLDMFDVLLIDLPDAGTRVYTFMSTMAYCLEEAAIHHKRVVVLDRPNPVGGDLVEGNVLENDCRSFVGLYAVPMRHGMTLGELALFINSQLPQAAELTVIPMEGWRRRFFYPETGQPWVYPSPNLPSFASALVYPGQVIWEGTNISEGRGTTLPFELWGAPFIKHERIMAALTADDLPGCLLRPVFFEPLANKWAAETCAGFQIQVTNQLDFRPYHVSLALLRAVMTTCGDDFKLKKPPYEYEFERTPLDLILGSKRLRRELAAGRLLAELETEWQPGLSRFKEKRQKFLLYS